MEKITLGPLLLLEVTASIINRDEYKDREGSMDVEMEVCISNLCNPLISSLFRLCLVLKLIFQEIIF
jgi:hypothetical protein